MNNKRISNVKAIFITIFMCITFISLPIQSVKATQTRKDNFNKNYSLTGNGPSDMLSIAFAQVGKTGNDLGYSEAWCANFVSDCADLAGQSQAIPRHGAVSSLRDLVISAGGSYVTSPIPGDLVIWKNSISHVEIVSKVENGVVYSIGGNNGRTGNPKTNHVAGERRVTSIGTVTCYVRPNYSGEPKPELVTPTINTDKSSYNIGDAVNISWAASPSNSNLSHYWLNVIAPDGTWIYGGTMNKETSYSFVASQTGNYSVTTYATPIGSKEGEGSLTDTKTVNVTEANWYGNLSAVDVGDSFYAYIINVAPWKHLTNNNGNVEISAETAATSQIWRFSRNSDGSYKIVNCADGNCLDVYGAYSDSGTNVQTYPAHDDTPAQKWFIYGSSGEYIFRAGCTDCVLDVNGGWSNDGTNVQMWTKNDSSAQTFQIWKLMPELSVETGNKAKLTNFTWTNFPGSDRAYDLKIWKGTLWEGDAYQIDWSLKDNDQKIDLPAGHYEAYIDTRVGTEQLMSNVVKFDITEDYFGQSEIKVVAGDKYTKTHFEWTPVEKSEFYDLKIWNGTVWEGDAYQIEWSIKDTSIDLALPAGYYEAYIDARDANHMQMSNVVKFAVKRDYQVIEGDANDDGKVTVADAVMLQKWLLGSGELTCWQNVDLCKDNRIDVFDLCLMKRMLIENSGVVF